MLTVQDIEAALPSHLKGNATQDLADLVNNASTNPEMARAVRDNFLSYAVVLKEGRFKVEDYLNAVAYVTYKVMGYSNEESFKRTFPERHAVLVARGATAKEVSSHVSHYNKNKLVNLILEQTLIPSWILNQDVYQKAINTQLELMTTAKSEKVRSDAANSILTHLKKPEKKEVELNISATETSGMRELKDMLTSLAERQRSMIDQGVPTREIAHQVLMTGGNKQAVTIEGEARDVTPDQGDDE